MCAPMWFVNYFPHYGKDIMRIYKVTISDDGEGRGAVILKRICDIRGV